MALGMLIWDKNTSASLAGTEITQALFGKLFGDVVTRERQFLRPVASEHLQLTWKAGAYVALEIDGKRILFGCDSDTTYTVTDLLDTGVQLGAGKDYYVYLCYELTTAANKGYAPVLKVSLNSTYPSGFTADTSRKIGGFHTLCLSVGTISGHPLSDFTTGDILPASVWDLTHRPTCQPEGMVYISELDFWADIYLQSGSGVNTKSVYNGTTTDSQSQGAHVEDLFKVGKTPLSDPEFSCAAEGSNQGTAIQGAADAVTTGGHVDSGGRRMISNYGLEDCCGFLNQWLDEQGPAGGSNWSSAGDGGKGYVYGNVYALLAGGGWTASAYCGSRCRAGGNSRLCVYATNGCRGRARSRV